MNKQRSTTPSQLCLLALLGSILFAAPISAQVFDLGPSDPALFDNVINLPPDPDIGPFTLIGGDGETTQLNVSDGGFVGGEFDARNGLEVNITGGLVDNALEAFSGSEINISGGTLSAFAATFPGSVVNISGGSVGISFEAGPFSEVNISGGTVGRAFEALGNSEVNISGGSVGHLFEASSTSNVELIGGEFQLNGTAFSGPTISLNFGDVFTGTLADGSAFIFVDKDLFAVSLRDGDSISNCLLYTSPSPRDKRQSRMPSSA